MTAPKLYSIDLTLEELTILEDSLRFHMNNTDSFKEEHKTKELWGKFTKIKKDIEEKESLIIPLEKIIGRELTGHEIMLIMAIKDGAVLENRLDFTLRSGYTPTVFDKSKGKF